MLDNFLLHAERVNLYLNAFLFVVVEICSEFIEYYQIKEEDQWVSKFIGKMKDNLIIEDIEGWGRKEVKMWVILSTDSSFTRILEAISIQK